MLLKRLVLLLMALQAIGCSDDQESVPAPVLPVGSIPGVYSGVFPCDGCEGIATTLWLRADGTYFFEQRYAAAADRSKAYELKRELDRLEVFADYEDRFLDLFSKE